MVTLGRIKNNDISISGELNERLPLVTNGLVAHFPFDGKGGSFSSISGHSVKQGMEKGLNLVEALSLNWRDPNSWTSDITSLATGIEYDPRLDALKLSGYRRMWLKTPIVIDPDKRYQISIEVMIEKRNDSFPYTYVGGNSLTVDGTKATRNYDYTLGSGWNPTRGVWHHLKLTRTGLNVASNSLSQSFENIKGWKGDADNNPIVKYYHFGGLFNYQDDSGVTYIRNLKIEVVSDDTSNALDTVDAFYMDTPGANLDNALSLGKYNPYNNHQSTFSMVDTGEKMFDCPIFEVTITPTNETQLNAIRASLNNQGIVSPKFTFKAKTRYSCSVYWKSVSHHNMEFGGVPSNIGNFNAGYNEYINDGWHRYHRYRENNATVDAADGVHYAIRVSDAKMNEPIKFLYACPQIEEGATYPGPYMLPGKPRTSKVVAHIDDLITSWTEGTIHLKFKPTYVSAYDPARTDATGLNRIISIVNRYAGNEIFDGMSIIVNSDGVTAETISSTNVRHSTTPMSLSAPGVWSTVTLRWKRGTSFDFSLTINGTTQSTSASLSLAPAKGGVVCIGDLIGFVRTCAGGYKDLSVYDRMLTNDEVEKMHKSSPMTVSPNGDLVSSKLVEKSIDTNNELFHFPLLGTTDEVRGRATAAKKENLIFCNEGVYPPRAVVVNYAKNALDVYAQYYTYTRDGNNHTFYRQEGSTSPSLYARDSTLMSSLVDGDSYTVSGYLYRNGKPVKMTGGRIHVDRIPTKFVTESNGYFASTQVYKSTDSQATWTLGHIILDNVAIGETIEIRDLQVTKGDIIYPFFPTTTSAGRLGFNLHRDFGVNWGGNWTVCYWKKPVGCSNGRTQSYSIDCLGSGTSTNKGYIWWGKDSANANTIYQSTPLAMDINEYMDNWRFISLVKNGVNITIRETDYFGNSHVRTDTIASTTPANYYVNNDGVDLTLGAYDYNNEFKRNDAIFRDLIVATRALSDDELNSIFKRQLKLSNEGITLSGILKEGQLH